MKVWRACNGGETIHPGGCNGAAWSGDGVNGMTTPTTMWKRITRRLGHDGNLLRRRCDVIDAWLMPIAIAIFVGLSPLVVTLAGSWMHTANASEQRAQVHWHHVPGVLLQPVPGPEHSDHGTNSWITWAPARWTEAGKQRTGEVPALAGSKQGSAVTVWLDAAGQVRMPPLTAGQAGGRMLEARVGGLAVLAGLLGLIVLATRRVLDRRRLAGWEAAWLSVGPTWSRHR